MDNVVAVGATDREGVVADFTPNVAKTSDAARVSDAAKPADTGRQPVPWIDFWARGVGVESTYLTGRVDLVRETGNRTVTFAGRARWSGTSFAAAAVSGALAANTGTNARTAGDALRLLRGEAKAQTEYGQSKSSWDIKPA
jgi:hypothetical protein